MVFLLVSPENSLTSELIAADIFLDSFVAKFYCRAAMFHLALFLIIEGIEPVGKNFF